MLKTGDPSINWSSFRPCSDRKKVVWIDNGDITEIGSTFEEVWIDEEKDLLFRKQELHFLDPNKPPRRINLVLKRSTFEPISCSDDGPFNVKIIYQSNEIIVNSTLHDKVEGVFDLFSIELLLRILPLEIGYSIELQTFNHMEHQTVSANLQVLQIDKVSNGMEEVDAWCIRFYFGDKLQTYWISCETKKLLKQSVKISNGIFFDFVR
ncbi:hypothetical protein [Neobacillus sp. D3-1R]|uniref:hypothetical protein n=1 Tax=Neobacillus sp. D3-1R TaxID=3445778 RepID=UPI003FA01761